jgi:phospholipid/cholesterol/gamma-HCH transport system substrate-binding protein
MTDSRQLWLGLLILVSLGTLGAYTLFGSDLNLFGDKLFIEVEFPEADGIRKGDPVMLAGVRVGRVTDVEFRPDAPDSRRILAKLRIDEPIALREGYRVRIEAATMLGGRLLAIEPGPFGAAALEVADGTLLTGEVAADAFDSLAKVGDLIGEEGPAIKRIIGDLEAIVADLREGGAGQNLSRGLESLAQTGESLERMTASIEAGEGSIGQLYANGALYDTWSSVGANADALLVEAREGRGLVGRLVSDSGLADRVENTVVEIEGAASNLRGLTEGAAENGSVAQRLFQDGQLGQDLASIGSDLRAFSDRLANADGTVARLIDSPELYDTLLAAGRDVRQITEQVAQGRGTVGRLIMSDDIYDEIALALRTANRGLEDYREAAPITTFSSILFAGF